MKGMSQSSYIHDTDNSVVMARGKGSGAGWRWAMGVAKGNIGNSVNNKNKVQKNKLVQYLA